jgi:hypothetical protein
MSLEARQIPYHTRRVYSGDLRRFASLVGTDLEYVTIADIELFLAAGDVQITTRLPSGSNLTLILSLARSTWMA